MKFIIHIEFALGIMSKEIFISFNEADNDDKCLEYDYSYFRITDIEKGMSLGQIGRLTGVSFGVVRGIFNK